MTTSKLWDLTSDLSLIYMYEHPEILDEWMKRHLDKMVKLPITESNTDIHDGQEAENKYVHTGRGYRRELLDSTLDLDYLRISNFNDAQAVMDTIHDTVLSSISEDLLELDYQEYKEVLEQYVYKFEYLLEIQKTGNWDFILPSTIQSTDEGDVSYILKVRIRFRKTLHNIYDVIIRVHITRHVDLF